MPPMSLDALTAHNLQGARSKECANVGVTVDQQRYCWPLCELIEP